MSKYIINNTQDFTKFHKGSYTSTIFAYFRIATFIIKINISNFFAVKTHFWGLICMLQG